MARLSRAALVLVVVAAALLGAGPASAALPHSTAAATAPIEALSPYQPQRVCTSTYAKPGVVAFERMVLKAYPTTHSDGIVNTCAAEGMTSEHSEGRAWDWGVSAANAADEARVKALMTWLFATDAAGHRYANARRLGIMYIIWDRHIRGSYAASAGWRPYSGASPHTDHVHFSFSWSGALAKTSFWSGRAAGVTPSPAAPAPTTPVAPRPTATPAPAPVGDDSPSPATPRPADDGPVQAPRQPPVPTERHHHHRQVTPGSSDGD